MRMLTLRGKGKSPKNLATVAVPHTKQLSPSPIGAPKTLGPLSVEESEVLRQLDLSRMPRHVAVIMDGNGRWAQRRHLPRIAGHRYGTKTARTTIETCARLNIEALTLYAFSVENWRRPKVETDFLMQLLREYIRKEMPLIQRNNIRMRFLGRIDELPPGVQKDVRQATEQTAANTGMCLCIAFNYGGRAEIVDAMNAILAQRAGNGANGYEPLGHADNGDAAKRNGHVSPRHTNGGADQPKRTDSDGHFQRITEDEVSSYLYTEGLPDPDLLIRTSGEMRVSNFLLWQIAYAEMYVSETLWPDFNRARLLEALVEFQKRDRRYGGLQKPNSSTHSDEASLADSPHAAGK
ncbi:MAG TPA: polyprenyl diphosphate synthase [Methylomirabilota bacterium]|jgi:undecaprenyl diphosphate synthase|nr:polyprenyl diphosphate synthase [Methylomirabilota bacterium]